MSLFKMKRGQESKVSSLAKEDGSLIFSLDGANDSTLRLDQSVSGTVQRLGVAVDKAKDADSVIDYNEPTRHIKIGYSGAGLSTSNLNYIAGYTNNGTQIKDVSKDVLKSWLGVSDSAKVIEPFENATANVSRNVWFSDSEIRNKPVYNDNFKYNPVTQILTTNISGTAALANLINYYQQGSQRYVSGDTHIMELGYLKCNNSYQNLTLYITSAFWGNQHGSADFVNIQQDTNTNDSDTVQSYAHAIRVGGNYDRTFYAYKDQTNKRLYLYVQVIGGNSYGKWNVSVIQCSSGYNAWVSEFGFNKTLPTGYETVSKEFLGTASNSNALGGSSLSQVLASAGGGNAFTGLDTTTNNKIKLTRANGGTVEKTINNVSNASSANFASTATLAAYPQGFESRMTSATWGNTTGTFLTGWHTSSGGDVAFMNNNPSSGKLSMKLDGYFYQNEGVNRVLDTSDAANYVKKAGDTMTGLLTLKTGSQQGIKLGSAYISNQDATNGEIVLQGGHLRFGASDWDYNKWAGLKYDADNKHVYLGIADGTVFAANRPQSGGLLFTPGISGIYIGGTTTTRVATSSDLSSYVAKSGGTMTGALNFANNTWNTVGDDVKIGDHNVAGGLGVIGANGDTRIDWCKYGDASTYQSIIFDGTKLATAGTFKADYFDGLIANASSAENSVRLGGRVSTDYALKADLSGTINALSAKRLESYQSASVANSFFYRYGTAGNSSDGGNWTGFPSAVLYADSSTVNGFGSALYRKKVGVLHLASGSSAHDLVFQAGGTNGGIAYVATGRNPAYILDTLNYKDKAYTFNKLTASSTFTATSGVVIDGGSY